MNQKKKIEADMEGVRTLTRKGPHPLTSMEVYSTRSIKAITWHSCSISSNISL